MELTRRRFLQASTIGGTIALGFDVSKAQAEMRAFKISRTIETRSTCPYCAVSCGMIIHTLGDKAKNATPAVIARISGARHGHSGAGAGAGVTA